MVTCFIVGRIWFMSRGTAMYSLPTTSTTRKAMNIVIESGIIYFVVQFVFVVVYGLNHPSEVILIVIATQTYVRTLLLLVLWPRRKKTHGLSQGISSTLIILHVDLGLSWEQTSKSAAVSGLSWARTTRSGGHTLSADMSTSMSSGPGRSTGIMHRTEDVVELVVPNMEAKEKLRTATSSGSTLSHSVV